MGAFEHVLVLVSFVYAVALTHLLGFVAASIRNWERLRFSWIHAFWVLNAFILIIANWISLWDLRNIGTFGTGLVVFTFVLAFSNYLQAALVSPEMPASGAIDLEAFHDEQGRRYILGFMGSVITALIGNAILGASFNIVEWSQQNLVVAPMLVVAIVAAIFVRNRAAQAACAFVQLTTWAIYFGALQGALR
ncbi:MAG: hypothetical protein JSR60_08590 [Proteobacteria bacterium]|nr:hypothetical protein [Pseudomonadota bacterium]